MDENDEDIYRVIGNYHHPGRPEAGALLTQAANEPQYPLLPSSLVPDSRSGHHRLDHSEHIYICVFYTVYHEYMANVLVADTLQALIITTFRLEGVRSDP